MPSENRRTNRPPIAAVFYAAAFLSLFYFFFTKPESPGESMLEHR